MKSVSNCFVCFSSYRLLRFCGYDLRSLYLNEEGTIVSWPATIWGLAMVMVHACPSVCLSHANISKTKRDYIWLLGNSNRNPGFPIQNLPSDS